MPEVAHSVEIESHVSSKNQKVKVPCKIWRHQEGESKTTLSFPLNNRKCHIWLYHNSKRGILSPWTSRRSWKYTNRKRRQEYHYEDVPTPQGKMNQAIVKSVDYIKC